MADRAADTVCRRCQVWLPRPPRLDAGGLRICR